LKNVRAENLQDLVYKNGQAGITKATVTIIFDNRDRNNCPIGYERCEEITVTRQIVVGGKNKYLINGKNAQNKAVQDLFCSVQMNVNNPNFLIMQGRVTKVLNMNPTQILSMIEEAAGTSMYETKREKSIALIEKKESKLNELNLLIKDDIEPKLDQLRQDKKRYIEYQNMCRDIEYLTRICISYKYLHYQKAVQSSETLIGKLTEQISNDNEKIKAQETEVQQIDETVKEIQGLMDMVIFIYLFAKSS
jgi:structural maintenance of chromosome 2